MSILESQDIELQQILGTTLYNDYIDKIKNDQISGSTLYTNLDERCFKVVLYSTINRSLMKMLVKFNNKNIGIKDSDNTQPIDFKTLNFIKTDIKNDYEFYAQRLIDYLEENATDFDTYDKETDIDQLDPNRRSVYSTGIDLTSRKNRCLYNRIGGDNKRC